MSSERRKIAGKDTERSFVNTPILLSDLALYKLAAEQSGYTVKLIARVGEAYTIYSPIYRGRFKTKRVESTNLEVDTGYIAVCIIKPPGEQDHVPFWSKLTELRASLNI